MNYFSIGEHGNSNKNCGVYKNDFYVNFFDKKSNDGGSLIGNKKIGFLCNKNINKIDGKTKFEVFYEYESGYKLEFGHYDLSTVTEIIEKTNKDYYFGSGHQCIFVDCYDTNNKLQFDRPILFDFYTGTFYKIEPAVIFENNKYIKYHETIFPLVYNKDGSEFLGIPGIEKQYFKIKPDVGYKININKKNSGYL